MIFISGVSVVVLIGPVSLPKVNFWSNDRSSKIAAKSAQNPSGAGLTQNADQADSEEGVTRSESSLFRTLTFLASLLSLSYFIFLIFDENSLNSGIYKMAFRWGCTCLLHTALAGMST